jgi:hypothetical protein
MIIYDAYLCLSNGVLYIPVSDMVSYGVFNANTVALQQKIVIDHCLNVVIETLYHITMTLHGHDMHEGA